MDAELPRFWCIQLIQQRFGYQPGAVLAAVARAPREWLQRLRRAESLDQTTPHHRIRLLSLLPNLLLTPTVVSTAHRERAMPTSPTWRWSQAIRITYWSQLSDSPPVLAAFIGRRPAPPPRHSIKYFPNRPLPFA